MSKWDSAKEAASKAAASASIAATVFGGGPNTTASDAVNDAKSYANYSVKESARESNSKADRHGRAESQTKTSQDR